MKKPNPLWEAFLRNRRLDDCPIYDLHGHMGPFAGIFLSQSELPVMVETLERDGVEQLVFCHHDTLFSPDAGGNRLNIEAVRRFPERLAAYCGLNPNYPEQVAADLDAFDRYRDVFVGFKLLADYHQVPITDACLRPAWEKADRERLPVLLHTWQNSVYDGPVPVRKIAERYHRVPILLGHSFHRAWDEAVKIAREFDNIYLELTAVPDERGALELFVGELGSERVIYGTDFPWFSHHYYIGAVLGAGLGEGDCRNIFYRNARRLLDSFQAGRRPGRGQKKTRGKNEDPG